MSGVAVVGIGLDGRAGLDPHARGLLDAAVTVIGGERHLRLAAPLAARTCRWGRPFESNAGLIRTAARPLVVLASGDPSWYGVARQVRDWLEGAPVEIVPRPGCVSLACARLGWPIETVEVVSLHGRPAATLARWLQPGRRLLVLVQDRTTGAVVATRLAELGLADSPATILEDLGGSAERVVAVPAAALGDAARSDLAVIALDLGGAPGGAPALVPGLADDLFAHDGQLTKREVRAAALARLAPRPGERLWDVGAGSGSVAIEWLRAERGCEAIAIERDPERAARITANAARLGVPGLHVVSGEAPAILAGLPSPKAVFVGGGTATPGLLDAVWAALPSGGRLVAHAVTLPGEMALLARHAALGGDLVRIAIERVERVGGIPAWRPALPVTQLVQVKP